MKPKKTFADKSNLMPLADRVLIENIPPIMEAPPPTADQMIDGILVPANSRAAKDAAVRSANKPSDGYVVTRVLKTGSECKAVEVGDRILIARHHAFINAKVDDIETTFVKETDIIAVMK